MVAFHIYDIIELQTNTIILISSTLREVDWNWDIYFKTSLHVRARVWEKDEPWLNGRMCSERKPPRNRQAEHVKDELIHESWYYQILNPELAADCSNKLEFVRSGLKLNYILQNLWIVFTRLPSPKSIALHMMLLYHTFLHKDTNS